MLKLKYKVYSNDLLIGETDLEFFDSEQNVYNGQFFPNADYAKVQPVFLKFGRATINPERVNEQLLNEYYRAQVALKLNVKTQDGKRFLAEGVHIYDYSFDNEFSDEYMIDVYLPEEE